jgi:hypothetical protein
MKRIRIEPDIEQFLAGRAVDIGESPSSILRRELHLPDPPGTIELDDDVYGFLASRAQTLGESASSILRRELHLEAPPPVAPAPGQPPVNPAPAPGGPSPTGPRVIVFEIPAGTGNQQWNTAEAAVVGKVGDTLRIVNKDSVPHLPHTNAGRPFPHPSVDTPIGPGQSADFLLRETFNDGGQTLNPLTDHLSGGRFFIKVTAS